MLHSLLTGQNTDGTSLFTYDGTGDVNDNWGSHVDAAYQPVFFNPDLTVMFSDDSKRTTAISTCNNGATTDDNPTLRRECYFDFKVTDNADLASATSDTKAALDETKSTLGNYLLFCFYLISILYSYNCEKFRYLNQNEILGEGGGGYKK